MAAAICARHLKHSRSVHVQVGQPKMLLRKLIFKKSNFYIFYKFVQVKNKAGWKWVSHQLWIMSWEADQSPQVCDYADQSQEAFSFPPLSVVPRLQDLREIVNLCYSLVSDTNVYWQKASTKLLMLGIITVTTTRQRE